MTRKGFDQELHKRALLKLLLDICKQADGAIALKGGTCAYLFYDLPRLSLDLDFDVLHLINSDMLDTLKVTIEKTGRIKEFREKRYAIFFLLDYLKDAPNIKIELNQRTWKHNSYKSIWLLGVEIKIADESTLFTNKIIALTDRPYPVGRDLFDICFFLKMGFQLNELLITERTSKTAKEYIKSLIPFVLSHYSQKSILHGLGDVLDEKQKEWAKKELIQTTIEELNKVLRIL